MSRSEAGADARNAAWERVAAAQGRSAAVAVCDQAIRAGCGGTGCTSAGHREHAAGIVQALQTLGLMDPGWHWTGRNMRGRMARRVDDGEGL